MVRLDTRLLFGTYCLRMTTTTKTPPTLRRRLLKWFLGLLAILVLGVGILAGVLYHEVHRSNGEVLTGGQKRSYLLHVPKSYQPGRPTPLVISLHGLAEWPAHLMDLSHWNQVADESGFLVVYPMGRSMPRRWFCNNRPGELVQAQQDVQFIADLIDHLGRSYNIDKTRVYANGLSNGGGMSFLLACRLSDRIAAIGGCFGRVPAALDRIPAHASRAHDPVPWDGRPDRAFRGWTIGHV